MKLQLNQKEIEKVLLAIFRDGGLTELYNSGVDYNYDKERYNEFKIEGNYFEGNLLNLLNGGYAIKFIDFEGEGSHNAMLSMKSAKEKLETIEDISIIEDVIKIIDENGDYDAWTCYNILQFILYGEIIFG